MLSYKPYQEATLSFTLKGIGLKATTFKVMWRVLP
jgi:hypothetical protein